MILTRFSRVTFNAAHKYLGLTSEVLRTEKAINDIACHPLPASFYQMGGLQLLRQRFDSALSLTSDTETDHKSVSHSLAGSSRSVSRESSSSSKTHIFESPVVSSQQSTSFVRGPRNLVQAGDLLIPSSHSYGSPHNRALPRSYSLLNTPHVTRSFDLGPGLSSGPTQSQRTHGLGIEDSFDLREEVMSCIAKSIGLLQPPLSGSDSPEPSPLLRPTDSKRPSETFSSPFGSLSLLDGGDDSSSITTGTSSGGYMSGLDNEVEILHFAAGSTLAKAGELNTGELYSLRIVSMLIGIAGLFYVIEGFLDILLPTNSSAAPGLNDATTGSSESLRSDKVFEKLLFTVKPGGIAGYLCKHSSRVLTPNSECYCSLAL